MTKRKGWRTSKPREVSISSRIRLAAIDEFSYLASDVELTEEEYLRLAKAALLKRRLVLAMVFLANSSLISRSEHLLGERRHDGSGILDVALPPLDAIDAIASLDEQRERWIHWYGYEKYLTKRRRAAVMIVLGHYARKAIDTLGKALKIKTGGE